MRRDSSPEERNQLKAINLGRSIQSEIMSTIRSPRFLTYFCIALLCVSCVVLGGALLVVMIVKEGEELERTKAKPRTKQVHFNDVKKDGGNQVTTDQNY